MMPFTSPFLTTTLCLIAGIIAGIFIDHGARRSSKSHGGLAVPTLRTIQAITGLAFALVGFRIGFTLRLGPILLLTTTLIAVSIIDWCQHRIPNMVIKPAFGASLITLLLVSAFGEPGSLSLALLGAAAFSGLLGGIHLLKPAGMGMGDVRLAALLGLFVGWLSFDWLQAGWRIGFVLLLASTFGLLSAAMSSAEATPLHKDSSGHSIRQMQIPFGPALSLATGLVILGLV